MKGKTFKHYNKKTQMQGKTHELPAAQPQKFQAIWAIQKNQVDPRLRGNHIAQKAPEISDIAPPRSTNKSNC